MRSYDSPNHRRRRTDMPRHIKIGLIVFGIGGAIAMGFFVDIVGRVRSMVNERETEENPFKPPAQPLYAPTDPPMTVKIFFPAASGDSLLVAEDRRYSSPRRLQTAPGRFCKRSKKGQAATRCWPHCPKKPKFKTSLFLSKG